MWPRLEVGAALCGVLELGNEDRLRLLASGSLVGGLCVDCHEKSELLASSAMLSNDDPCSVPC